MEATSLNTHKSRLKIYVSYWFYILFVIDKCGISKKMINAKSKNIIVSAVVLWISLWTSSVESKDSINLGYGGINPMPHCHAEVYNIEYEHQLTQTFSILGRGSRVNYKDDDEEYQEDGKLRGLDVGTRYYFTGDMHGFFAGGSLGYWTDHWTSIGDKNRLAEWRDKASSKSLRVNADVGYRFPIPNTNISIIPQLNFGKFFSSSTCEFTAPSSRVTTPCSETSVVNYYLFIGAAVGIAF